MAGQAPTHSTRFEEALVAVCPDREHGLARRVGLQGVLERVLGVERESTQVGRYVVERRVGSGRTGAVFRARDTDSDTQVAIKLFHRDGIVDRARFERVAQGLVAVVHPCVVRCLDHGTTPDGQHYLAMEWLDGCSLAARLESGPLGVGDALALAIEAAKGLAALHAAGVVHGDVRPSSLFLVNAQGDRIDRIKDVRVIDVGLAPANAPLGASRTSVSGPVTSPYAAPEQLRGESEARSDIYGLGAVLFESLAGRPPAGHDGTNTVHLSAEAWAIPHWVTLSPDVAEALETLVRRMLARDVRERPADMDTVVRELSQLEPPIWAAEIHLRDGRRPRPVDLSLGPTLTLRGAAGPREPHRRPPFAPGALVDGRYRVEELLGRGGMGVVYRVSDEAKDGRTLALKTISEATLHPDVARLLQAEFRTMSRFRHPNIGRVYDLKVGQGTEPSYFTMELVRGRNILAATEGAQLDHVLELVVPLCRALSYLHRRNIIHFDLKPGNVLVTEQGHLKVVDFGLADVARHPNELRGTPEYMAPELVDAFEVDHRLDLYSLGILVYQLATRHVPFSAPTEREVFCKHAFDPLPFSRADRRRVPPWLRHVLERLCAKAPADRYRSADAVIQAINEGRGTNYALETKETRESYVLSSGFVGREEELARVMGFYGARLLGAPRVRSDLGSLSSGPSGDAASTDPVRPSPLLLVAGQSGVGKSRLMREVRHRVQLSGVPFVESRCREAGPDVYGPFVELTRLLAALAEGAGQRELVDRYRDALARVDPASSGARREVAPPLPLESAERERLRLLEALTAFILDVADQVPCLLFVDDLHWASQATVDLLRHLVRRLELAEAGGRIFSLAILGAFREDEVAGTPLAKLLDERPGRQVSEIVELAPLGAHHVHRMVASMLGVDDLPKPFVTRLFQETAGVPFFVQEVMRVLVENGSVYLKGGSWAAAREVGDLTIPDSMASAFRRRVTLLDDEARSLLELLVVNGQPAKVRRLRRIVPKGEGALERPLNTLIQHHMVRRTVSDGRLTYEVSHDCVRECVYEDIQPKRRRTLHLELARALERAYRGGRSELVFELAHHFEAAECADEALEYAVAAGDEAMQTFANDRALELYEKARRLLDATEASDSVRALAIDEKLGDLCSLVGHFADAREHYERVLDAVDQAEDQARLHRKTGALHYRQGWLRQSVDELWRAVELLGGRRPRSTWASRLSLPGTVGRHLLHRAVRPRPPLDPVRRARLLELSSIYSMLGEVYFFHDSSEMLLPILRAANAGERAGRDSEALFLAYKGVMVLYGTLTLWDSAEHFAGRLEEMAAELGSDWHLGIADTYRLMLHCYRGAFEPGLSAGRRGRERLLRCGDMTELSFAYGLSALCHIHTGSLDEGARLVEEGIGVMLRTDSKQPSKSILAMGGRIAAKRGEPERAQALLGESLELSREAHDVTFETWVGVMRGEALLARGEVDAAIDCLEQARQTREAKGLMPEFLIETYPLLAVAHLERVWTLGAALRPARAQLRPAKRATRRALRLTRRRRHYRSPALRAAAVLAWMQDRRSRAKRLFDRAESLAGRLGARLQLAEVRFDRGRCLLLSGRERSARQQIAEARRLFEACGAAPAAQRSRELLDKVPE